MLELIAVRATRFSHDQLLRVTAAELDAVAARLDEAARQAGVCRMCTETDPTLYDEEVPGRGKAV